MEQAIDRIRRSRLAPLSLRAAGALATCAAAGFLASGSCAVSACYEECDPCFQACQCSTVCHNLAAGEPGLRIVAHESRVAVASDRRYVRLFDVVVGPSLEFEPEGGPERLPAFARRVLDVNAGLFTAQRDPVWRLDDVQVFPERRVLQFELASEPFAARRSNSVSLLFDARGRLLEATHVVERASD